MAECDWAIICDYAFLDLNRKTCIIGIFDRIYSPSVPSGRIHCALAMKFLGQAGEALNLKIQIIRPTGAQLAAFEAAIKLVDTGTAEMQINMANVALPDFGAYAFNIYDGELLLKTITFIVDQPPKRPAQVNQ